MIHKCGKDVVECDCEGALDRLKWLLSKDAPVVLGKDYAERIIRRATVLEGEQELKELVLPPIPNGGTTKDSSQPASAAVEQETVRITAEMLQHWWFVLAGDRNHWHFLADQINAYFKEKEPPDQNVLNLQMAQLRDAVEADKNHDDDSPDPPPPQDEHDCFCVRCCAIRFLSSHAPKSSIGSEEKKD